MSHHLSSLSPFVTRKRFEQVIRLLTSAYNRIDALAKDKRDLTYALRTAQQGQEEAQERLGDAQERVRAHEAALTQIRACMDRVAVFEGQTHLMPLPDLVSEVVRDHEELEARIDAAFMLIKAAEDPSNVDGMAIAVLLQGGTRVPDSPEGLNE